MKYATLLPAAILFLSTSALADPITVSGVGIESCSRWSQVHEEASDTPVIVNGLRLSPRAALMDEWVSGFVTAVNQFSADSNNANVQNGRSEITMHAWVSEYCALNPTAKIVTAAAHLVVALRQSSGLPIH